MPQVLGCWRVTRRHDPQGFALRVVHDGRDQPDWQKYPDYDPAEELFAEIRRVVGPGDPLYLIVVEGKTLGDAYWAYAVEGALYEMSRAG